MLILKVCSSILAGYEAESDADVLPEDHDILSDVIQEEFGASYSSLVDQQKQLLPMSNKETSYKKPLQPSTSMPKRSQVFLYCRFLSVYFRLSIFP